MKSFTAVAMSYLALTCSVASTPLSKRADASTFIPSIQALTANIKTYTGSLNSTAASYSSLSTADQALALSSIDSDTLSINDLVTSYTGQIPDLETGGAYTAKRQDANAATTELATDLASLLGEINSSLNYAQSETSEGLTITRRQIAVIPLGTSLSALLLALDAVVDDLLALVKEIVDSLLQGLAGSLVGIVL